MAKRRLLLSDVKEPFNSKTNAFWHYPANLNELQIFTKNLLNKDTLCQQIQHTLGKMQKAHKKLSWNAPYCSLTENELLYTDVSIWCSDDKTL